MDSRKQSPPPDAVGTKGAFRKPNNDAGNRKYRRRSPVSGSSSPDGSPKRGRSSSPISSKEDSAKVSEHRQRRNDDRREVDRDYGRSQYGKGGDVHRYSDRQSSRSSHGSSRHDDYRRGSDHGRPRDYSRNSDKYSRDRYDGSGYRSKDKDNETSSLESTKYKDSSSDRTGSGRRHTTLDVDEIENNRTVRERDSRDEKRDHRRSSGDHKSDLTRTYEESRERHNDSTSERDSSLKRFTDAYNHVTKELDVEKVGKGEKKHDDREPNKKKDWYGRETGDKFEDKSVYANKDQESQSKKPKIFSPEKSTDYVKVSKFSGPVADDKHLSTSKQAHEADGKVPAGQTNSAETLTANDINAAKVAAMKAAELVNRNIVGGGYLSTDQKKKLLWGNKKSSAAEESGHRWDASLFGDRERQEKFNKLMSLRLPYLWRIVGCEGRREGGPEVQQPGGCRGEAEGTPAGLGEAIHCRIKAKRWAYCWFGPLRTCLGFHCTLEATTMCCILLYFLLHVEIMLCYLKVEIFEKSHHAHNLLVALLFCNLHLLFASYFWIEDRE